MQKMKRSGGVRKINHRLTKNESDDPLKVNKVGLGGRIISSQPSSMSPMAKGLEAERKNRVAMNLTPSGNDTRRDTNTNINTINNGGDTNKCMNMKPQPDTISFDDSCNLTQLNNRESIYLDDLECDDEPRTVHAEGYEGDVEIPNTRARSSQLSCRSSQLSDAFIETRNSAGGRFSGISDLSDDFVDCDVSVRDFQELQAWASQRRWSLP